jgi:RimJ/RimL family protein N-acetyltransferase
MDRGPSAHESDGTAVHDVAGVSAADQTAQLPRQLVGIHFRENLARRLGLAGGSGQALDPVAHPLDDGISDEARPAVKFRRRRLEETAAGEDLPLQVGEMRVAKRPESADTSRCTQAWLQDLLGEDPSGLLHGRELELLLRTEVGKEPTLADAKVARQPLKRDSLQPFGRRQLGGVAEDRLPGTRTSHAAPIRTRNGNSHVHKAHISTTGRFILTLYDRSCYLLRMMVVEAAIDNQVGVARLEPVDAQALRRFFFRLSPETLYRRFLSPISRPEQARPARLLDVDHRDREALIGLVDGEIIGVARYGRLARTETADLAVVVADAWQRQGIATLLLRALGGAALAAGIHSFTVVMHADNRPVLALLRRLQPSAPLVVSHGLFEGRLPLPWAP